MARDATDQAYDEYYTTGIDPTGGEIGPDFDQKTAETVDDLDEVEQAFYAEESPWEGTTVLERMIDRKMAEVDALAKRQAAEKAAAATDSVSGQVVEDSSPVSEKTNTGFKMWHLLAILLLIVVSIVVFLEF